MSRNYLTEQVKSCDHGGCYRKHLPGRSLCRLLAGFMQFKSLDLEIGLSSSSESTSVFEPHQGPATWYSSSEDGSDGRSETACLCLHVVFRVLACPDYKAIGHQSNLDGLQ